MARLKYTVTAEAGETLAAMPGVQPSTAVGAIAAAVWTLSVVGAGSEA
jgi:hypothetical protein